MNDEPDTRFADLQSAIPAEAGGLDTVEQVFEWGWCHALALELHERTGWPLVGLRGPDRPAGAGERTPPSYRGELDHFAVQRPSDGHIVDVRGARPVADVGNYRVERIDIDYLRDPGDMERPSDVADLARQVADRILPDVQAVAGAPPTTLRELVSASYPTSLRESLQQHGIRSDTTAAAPSILHQHEPER
jgi:hypothetical protein